MTQTCYEDGNKHFNYYNHLITHQKTHTWINLEFPF